MKLFKSKTYLVQVMPCVCSLCGIGIGTSEIQFIRRWDDKLVRTEKVEHSCRVPHEYKRYGLKLCGSCYRVFKKRKNKMEWLGKATLNEPRRGLV